MGPAVVCDTELVVATEENDFDSVLAGGEKGVVSDVIGPVVWQLVLSEAGPVFISEDTVFDSELAGGE